MLLRNAHRGDGEGDDFIGEKINGTNLVSFSL